MVNAGGLIAHFVKLMVTLVCMKLIQQCPNSRTELTTRAYQILLTHSLLGILRYGGVASASTEIAKRFRNFYELFSRITEIVPFALLSSEILRAYKVCETVRITLIVLWILPAAFELNLKQRDTRARALHTIAKLASAMQLTVMMYISMANLNYSAISLAVSYAFEHFLSQEFCDRYDVPHSDLTQYCLCFTEMFAVAAFREI